MRHKTFGQASQAKWVSGISNKWDRVWYGVMVAKNGEGACIISNVCD